jgi:hypothetical protein
VKGIRAGFVLLLVQLLLVLSIAGKYLYERQTCPRVWSRATQFDPNLPLRGRYLAMRLVLDACGLPRETPIRRYPHGSLWLWHVSLRDSHGKLVPQVEKPGSSSSIGTVTLTDEQPCDRATLSSEQLLFIPERAQIPLPLKQGQDLWVEVTLPPSGPPRPIQAALSGADGFHPLQLN